MMTTIPLTNSNSLLILDKNLPLNQIALIKGLPSVVLLTAWKQLEQLNIQRIELLIVELINVGCKYFVCAGKHSETLHDFIDDIILDISLNVQIENSINIMTTWHDTDTNDEVADFFLHSTNVSDSLLVAFLDKESPEDNELKKTILELLKSRGHNTGFPPT